MTGYLITPMLSLWKSAEAQYRVNIAWRVIGERWHWFDYPYVIMYVGSIEEDIKDQSWLANLEGWVDTYFSRYCKKNMTISIKYPHDID